MKEIKDILDELNSIHNIFRQQLELSKSMARGSQLNQSEKSAAREIEATRKLENMQITLTERARKVTKLEFAAQRVYTDVCYYQALHAQVTNIGSASRSS
jgi:hypothetical protein